MNKEKKITIAILECDDIRNAGKCIKKLLEYDGFSYEFIYTSREIPEALLRDAKEKNVQVLYLPLEGATRGKYYNTVINEANGEYLVFLDSFDEMSGRIYHDMFAMAYEKELDVVQLACGTKDDASEGKYQYSIDEVEKEIRWIRSVGNASGGVYRKDFLTKNAISCNESSAYWFAEIGFMIQVIFHAPKAYVHKTSNIFSQNRELLNDFEAIKTLFNEYESIERFCDTNHAKDLCGIIGNIFYQDFKKIKKNIAPELLEIFLMLSSKYLKELNRKLKINYNAFSLEGHKEIVDIMNCPEEYCEKEKRRMIPHLEMDFLFPYHLFPRGSRIVICGAGNVGRMFYRQGAQSDYVNIIGIIDKNAGQLLVSDIPIVHPNRILQMEYDYVLIAVHIYEKYKSMKSYLIDMGVSPEKIRWDGGVYWREDYYRKLYFPLLNNWKESYRSHTQFLKEKQMNLHGWDHIFPYHIFKENDKILIYGAGNIGKKFYWQAMRDKYVEIVGIVDRNAKLISTKEFPIKSLDKIREIEYDYILITLHDQNQATTAKEELEKLGIPEDRIKWNGWTYYRDEFYDNLYLPWLRLIHKQYPERELAEKFFQQNFPVQNLSNVFPYEIFREGEHIVFYGDGKLIKEYCSQVGPMKYIFVTAIILEEADNFMDYYHRENVVSIQELCQMEYDAVFLAPKKRKKLDEMKENLVAIGVSEKKIRWDEIFFDFQDERDSEYENSSL